MAPYYRSKWMFMLQISNSVSIQDWELQLTAIRAQGAGGQNVNNTFYILEPQRTNNA